MADDIVTRLRHKYANQLPICAEAADEIERLRKENKELKDARIDLHTVDNIVGSVQDLLLAARRQYDTHLIQKDLIASKDDEIERLRTALQLAVGELSTHDTHRLYSPDQLYQQFLEEAHRG